MPKLRLFVLVYGDEFLDLYEKVCIRSLRQPSNAAALKVADPTISLYTDKKSWERAVLISGSLFDDVAINAHEIDTSNPYDAHAKAIAREMEICVKEDAALIMACPDSFWGDGSLPNLLDIAGEEEVCIASPHVRVDRNGFLGWLRIDEGRENDAPYDNKFLVEASMMTLHPSWLNADADKPESNSYYTGISIKHRGNLHYVTHLQPTIWYAKPTARDYAFFAENTHLRGNWDHFWPDIVAREGRMRVVSSSDAVFIAELTDAESHNTELRKVDPKKPDEFHRTAAHIALNRGIVSVWRE